MTTPFRRVAILGTGLIGGSFALALRKHAPDTIVIGWDKAHVLRHALIEARYMKVSEKFPSLLPAPI